MVTSVDSSTSAAVQSTAVSNWQQRQQSFKELTSALQSGDVSAAQKAFASLGQSASGQGPLAKIGTALQHGDVAGAKQAMQDVQASRKAHHHHHASETATAATQTPVNPAATPASGTVGSLVNTSA